MEEFVFFENHQDAFPIYECLKEKILEDHPDTKIKVQKTQISFISRHMFA